ncbi:hypothetical protein IP92_04855 [Pseudoduganella flava]|uniref:Uncharacterized protein n=1 Tax=Pseudoduganella flava TaxID=871742 RepID=A0A562PH85_9BURK|nr:hypothetical protein [Pseudoduganella flava]QGZ42642.1 hypothetical protein GO485_28810 [Pseudoduganella flava]TWI43801.1 hypothetical protein IP92_04855 [Pseudoduganella flava]
MNGIVTVGLPAQVLLKLARYFEQREEAVDLGAALGDIVETWLADRERAGALAERVGMAEGDVPRGYHWKELFLPHGTRLRLYLRGPDDYAQVVGDQLLFQGEPTSPNQFVRMFRYIPCNAWDNVVLLFPGERHWVRAKHLRRSHAGPRDRRGRAVSKSPAR